MGPHGSDRWRGISTDLSGEDAQWTHLLEEPSVPETTPPDADQWCRTASTSDSRIGAETAGRTRAVQAAARPARAAQAAARPARATTAAHPSGAVGARDRTPSKRSSSQRAAATAGPLGHLYL